MGLERYRRQASLFGRRLLLPDENVTYNLTAIPAAIRIVREEGIDVVDHDLAAAVGPLRRRRRQARDRRALGRRPARLARRAPAPRRAAARRAGEGAGRSRRSPRWSRAQADAIVTVSDAIADEMRARDAARAGA